MPTLAPVLGALIAAVFTAAVARMVIPILLRRSIVDVPNARSSHARVTPRGGGIAPVMVLAGLAAVAALSGRLTHELAVLAMLALVLAGLSLADDMRSLGAGLRLSVHSAVVVIALVLLVPADVRLLPQWVPVQLEWVLLALGWLWFINLFNFMDGIDGISGTELVSIGLGVMATLWAAGDDIQRPALMMAGGLLAGAGFGFLTVNWHPARVFMGDVGSVTLGFLAGGLLLLLAMAGHLASALILPAYYIVDATVTLLMRLGEGDRLSEAHRKHAYQRAVRGGLSHDSVCRLLFALNILLAGLAMLAAQTGSTGLAFTITAGAYGLALALFLFLRRLA